MTSANDDPQAEDDPRADHGPHPDAASDQPLLHHEAVVAARNNGEEPERWLGVLHGIYGAGRNWNSVARRLVRERPDWGAAMVDLREHGQSRGFDAPHTVQAAARDLLRTFDSEGPPLDAILGHSFGGKVALEAVRQAAGGGQAQRDARSLPGQVWLIDSTPAVREPSGSAWGMLELLRRHPGPFRHRDEGVAALEDEGLATPIARWMGTNLEEGVDGAWRWRLDPDVMEALLRDFFALDLWEVVESPPEGVVVQVVKARDSSVLDGADLERVEAAAAASDRVRLHVVDGGHWLNAENPDALVELLAGEL